MLDMESIIISKHGMPDRACPQLDWGYGITEKPILSSFKDNEEYSTGSTKRDKKS